MFIVSICLIALSGFYVLKKTDTKVIHLLCTLLHDLNKDFGQLFIVHLVVLVGLVSLFIYQPVGASDAGSVWANWFTVVAAVLALAIWVSDIYERWKHRLPKELTIIYVLTNKDESKQPELIGGYFGVFLPHDGDVRNIGQAVGVVVFNSGSFLNYDMAKCQIFEHPSPTINKQGEVVMRYALIMPLLSRPVSEGEVSNCVTFESYQKMSPLGKFTIEGGFWVDFNAQNKSLLDLGFPSEFEILFKPFTQ